MDQRLGTRDTVGNLIDIESKKISLQATEKHHFTKNDAKIRVIYMLYFMLKFNFIFSKKKNRFWKCKSVKKKQCSKVVFLLMNFFSPFCSDKKGWKGKDNLLLYIGSKAFWLRHPFFFYVYLVRYSFIFRLFRGVLFYL